MILIIVILTAYDSLPPLPDLSKSSFPEPKMLSVQPIDSLRFTGYAGQSLGADLEFYFHDFSLDAAYIHTNEWDSADIASASLSYKIFAPNMWIKPRLMADAVKRQGEYSNISPGLEFDLFSSSLVTSGGFEFNYWKLNDETVREASGRVLFTFDRISYMPQFEITGTYTGQRVNPSLYTQVHVGNFHLRFGSLVNNCFPSPRLSIRYALPYLSVSTGFNSGVQHSTLISLFDPGLPIRYPQSIPAETLSLEANIAFDLTIPNHHFRISGSYKEWLCRLDIGADYMISQILDVGESTLELSARNVMRFEPVCISNWLRFTYNASDSALTFNPDYSIADTVKIAVGIVELSADARFVSERSGLEKSLPSYYTVNTALGLRISFAKFYVAVNNITDNTGEIFDTYFMTGRQYAVGIELHRRL